MVMSHIYLKFFLVLTGIALSYSCPRNSTTVTFDEGFREVCGNLSMSDNGTTVSLSLRNNTGASVFISRSNYTSGLFSVNITLPSQNYSGGIVATFYLSNQDQYPHNHDEIDFEFLGHTNNGSWVLQTNFYGNGSIPRSREERYNLWFDPSKEAHRYSIFWSETRLTYYIDDIPIRNVQKVDAMGGDYPSKPMALFATIWDGSDWATDGGKSKSNFTFEPFVAKYTSFGINGCRVDPYRNDPVCSGSDLVSDCGNVTPKQLEEYEAFRRKYLTYTYCTDKSRYSTPLPECLVQPLVGKSI